MDSLFEKEYKNTQPLRKFEPLIRFDLEGNPLPRRPLGEVLTPKPQETKPKESRPQEPKPQEDFKRKVDPTPSGFEPKRKQAKQQSIMSFFTKKA